MLSVPFAAPALAQPYPEPTGTSTGFSVAGFEIPVRDARPDPVPQGAARCPSDIGSLVVDLRLAGLDARAANYAVYAITDDCEEPIDQRQSRVTYRGSASAACAGRRCPYSGEVRVNHGHECAGRLPRSTATRCARPNSVTT